MKHPNATVAVTVGTAATAITGTARLVGLEVPAELALAYGTLAIVAVLRFAPRSRRSRRAR